MNKDLVLAIFDDEEKLIHGAEKMRDKNISIFDIYTPFPVHGLDELMGIKRSILPYVTFAAGLMGFVLAMGFQVWASAVDWPINIGGKPFASIPAFIPITFELTVLFGAHTTVLAFLILNKLYPGKKVKLYDIAQTEDKFVLAVEKDKLDLDSFTSIVKEHGALEVREDSTEA